jgi:hypothetical protein
VNLMRSGGGGGEACVVVGDTSSEAGSRWVVAMAKRGMLSTWLGGVGGLAGSKLVAVRLVPRLGLLGMVVAERLVVVGIDGVGFVCIARGVCNPSGLSRRMTFFFGIWCVRSFVEGRVAGYSERVFNICASWSSLASIALFFKELLIGNAYVVCGWCSTSSCRKCGWEFRILLRDRFAWM